MLELLDNADNADNADDATLFSNWSLYEGT